MEQEVGRVPNGTGLSQAEPKVSALSGFDSWRVQGNRYSPNLAKWLRRNRRIGLPGIFFDGEGRRWIGWNDDEYFFHGSKLSRVLCDGARATVWAVPGASSFEEEPDFWRRYEVEGRCAIDAKHEMYFIGEETRWSTTGDTRECLWCGRHTQHLRRWTETINRERWEAASAIETGTAETAGIGPKAESAVPQADAQNTPGAA